MASSFKAQESVTIRKDLFMALLRYFSYFPCDWEELLTFHNTEQSAIFFEFFDEVVPCDGGGNFIRPTNKEMEKLKTKIEIALSEKVEGIIFREYMRRKKIRAGDWVKKS